MTTARQLRRNGNKKRAAAKAASQHSPQPDSPLATVKEAGKFLRLSKPSVYKLMDNGLLPFRTILRTRRIPWEALHKLAGLVN